MLTSPLPDSCTSYERCTSHERIARACILASQQIPAATIAVLEARGVNISELEARIIQNQEFRR